MHKRDTSRNKSLNRARFAQNLSTGRMSKCGWMGCMGAHSSSSGEMRKFVKQTEFSSKTTVYKYKNSIW